MPSDAPKTTQLHCNRCRIQTNHILRGEHEHGGNIETETWDGYYSESSLLYTCAGCSAPSLIVMSNCSEDDGPVTEYWPPRNYGTREEKQFHVLPDHLVQLYKETVAAFNSGSRLLCTIGLRTLLEGVCKDKGLKKGNLETKIEGLRKFFPTGNIVKYLHGFRWSGNEAAHDLEPMQTYEAKRALDVMEDLLGYLYDLDYKASRLKHAKKRVRKAKPKTKAGTAAVAPLTPTPSQTP
jgi:hypothetical protein